jgi:hypothetical protein
MCPRRLVTLTAKSALPRKREQAGSEMVPAVLTELFELLDEYGPHWYTEDLRDRYARAIAELEERGRFSLIQGRGSEGRGSELNHDREIQPGSRE